MLLLSVGKARQCTAAAVQQTAVSASDDDCAHDEHVIYMRTQEGGIGSTWWARRTKYEKYACRLQQAEQLRKSAPGAKGPTWQKQEQVLDRTC